ncbi:MAG: twin-arginine translocase TatA/TatE family subunit [Bacteroidota bacterium]
MITNFIIAGIIGTQEIIIILIIVLILFGAKKIPELMRGMGRGVKEFKDATSDKSKDKENIKDN